MSQAEELLSNLVKIVGKRYVITDPAKTLRYRRGYCSGCGDALAGTEGACEI